MIKRSAIFLTILLISALSLFGQDSLYSSRFQINPHLGVNIPLTKAMGEGLTDHLLEYDDHSFYWQVLSFTWFFRRHWGVEFRFQGMTSGGMGGRADDFMKKVQAEYGNEYFVTPTTGASYSELHWLAGHFERGLFGLVYRYETKRFFCYPVFSIGASSISNDWGKAILKRKHANEVREVSYDLGQATNDHFVIAPSVRFGYKLKDQFYLNLEAMASYFNVYITCTKTVKDLSTDISTSERINYDKDVFTLSLGGGLIYVIK